MVDLSIVIPTQGQMGRVRRVLESLHVQDLERNRFEVLVAGNTFRQELTELIDFYQSKGLPVSVSFSGSRGANCARNEGLKRAQGCWVYFLDDDCAVPTTHHLSQLLLTCTSQSEASILGGPYLTPDGSSLLDRAYNVMSMLWLTSQLTARLRPPVFLGGNFVVKHAAIGDLRFDETISYGGTELSFQTGLHARGGRAVYLPELQVHHQPQLKWKEFILKAWKQGHSPAGLEYESRNSRFRVAPRLAMKLLREPRDLLDVVVAGAYLALVQISKGVKTVRSAWT